MCHIVAMRTLADWKPMMIITPTLIRRRTDVPAFAPVPEC